MLVLFCGQGRALGQAWVSEPGSGEVGLTYQFDRSNTIVEGGGDIKLSGDSVVIHGLMLAADFSPMEKLGVSVEVPMLMSQYTGEGVIFSPHGTWDDGNVHASLQDLRADLRYELLSEPLVLTPRLGASVPMSDYEIHGFAAPGRGLKKLHIGLNTARTLDPWVPRLYFHALYEFSLVEHFDKIPEGANISQNYSRASLQVGYALTDALVGFAMADGLIHHGGVHFVDWEMLSSDVRDYHDVLLKERVYSLGLGLGYQLSDSLMASVVGQGFVRGNNTRAARVLAANLSWQFTAWQEEPEELEELEELEE